MSVFWLGQPQKTPRVAVASLTCAVLAFSLVGSGGCKGRENAVEDKGTDTNFLRVPGSKADTALPSGVTLGSGPLFPAGVGSRWEMETVQGPWSAIAAAKPTEVKISGQGTETIKVTGQLVLSGQTGAAFEIADTTAAADRSDKPKKTTNTRQEVYVVDSKGVFLLAAGGATGRMIMSPPLPLVAYPPKEGQVVQWSGVLHYKNNTVPATSLSRISAVQKIETPATPKGVAAYRVDTVVSTTLDTGQVSFPTTRWLAPGIGMVQQKLIAGDQLVLKKLRKYEVTK